MNHSKVILGTAQFGLDYGINNTSGKPPITRVHEVLELAYESGIRRLDTAHGYGDAEFRIGQFHKNNPKNTFQLITKWTTESKPTLEKIERQLQTCRVDRFHAILMHDVNDVENESFIRLLEQAKENHLTEKIGISVYNIEEYEKVSQVFRPDIIQMPFNLLDNQLGKEHVFKHAREHGIELHCRSVFLQGLFFIHPNEVRKKSSLLDDSLRKLKDLCHQYSISLEGAVLGHAQQEVSFQGIIFGVDSAQQLQRNLEAYTTKIPPEFIQDLHNITKNVSGIPALDPRTW